ncbi:hypothetical protein AAFX24_17275 [Vibrio mediterranei]|uniref:hypothetical protein n=1 Tax=Vibrio mediterranei TaxID=689 RepID=UPI0038CEDAA4
MGQSRKDAIRAAMQKQATKKSGPQSVPSMPAGDIDKKSEAKIDAELNLSRLRDNLEVVGLSFGDFLSQHANIVLSKPERQITAPSGETYTVATTHLSYEKLKEQCVIDDDNVRDASEHTEEALSDIIDEIGMGLQLMPIIAYIDEKGKTSIMEGGRRFSSAMLRKVGLDVDYFDRKPSEATVRWVVETSDKKKNFSYYDKGKLYSKLMATHGWSKADLVRERKYQQADVSDSVNFSKAPQELLDVLPSKSLPQSFVKKFNAAATTISDKKSVNEAIEFLVRKQSEKGSGTSIENSKRVVTLLVEFASTLQGTAKKTVKPIFSIGETSAFVKRSKKGSNINFNNVPRELEELVLKTVENLVKGKN